MKPAGLEGRTALVTGGSRGIGRAICVRLAQSGARVAINYVANAGAAEETRALVAGAGAEGRVYRADVSDLEQTRAMITAIERDLGPVELLVTNAGIARSADGASMDPAVWHEIMDVNVNGTFNPLWLVKDGMLERQYGRVVCISSVLGLVPNPITPARLIAYGTAKAAVIALVRNCAAAFGPHVRVNGVAPGYIATDMTADVSGEARERLLHASALRRIGEPEEIAELVEFLLSDRSSFTTGQTHLACGGMATLP